MSIEITCPKCGHPFAPEAVIREEIEKEVRNEAADWKKKKNEEYQQKLEEETKRIEEATSNAVFLILINTFTIDKVEQWKIIFMIITVLHECDQALASFEIAPDSNITTVYHRSQHTPTNPRMTVHSDMYRASKRPIQ